MMTTIGDLARNFMNQRTDARLTRDVQSLGRELTSGLVSDPVAHLRGASGPVAAIDRSLSLLDAYDLSRKKVEALANGAQAAMTNLGNHIDSLRSGIAGVLPGSDPKAADAASATARQGFGAFVATLNTQVAGESLFSGTRTTGPALRAADDILQDLVAGLAGITTAGGLDAAVDAYFAPGGAFETNDYLGSDLSRDDIRVGQNDTVSLQQKADDRRLRDGLAVLAKMAVLDMGVLAGQPDQRVLVANAAAAGTQKATGGIVAMAAEIGAGQERTERVGVQVAAERDSLARMRLDLLGADPYETAIRLQQTESQIETLYTLTARLSRLSLTAYL